MACRKSKRNASVSKSLGVVTRSQVFVLPGQFPVGIDTDGDTGNRTPKQQKPLDQPEIIDTTIRDVRSHQTKTKTAGGSTPQNTRGENETKKKNEELQSSLQDKRSPTPDPGISSRSRGPVLGAGSYGDVPSSTRLAKAKKDSLQYRQKTVSVCNEAPDPNRSKKPVGNLPQLLRNTRFPDSGTLPSRTTPYHAQSYCSVMPRSSDCLPRDNESFATARTESVNSDYYGLPPRSREPYLFRQQHPDDRDEISLCTSFESLLQFTEASESYDHHMASEERASVTTADGDSSGEYSQPVTDSDGVSMHSLEETVLPSTADVVQTFQSSYSSVEESYLPLHSPLKHVLAKTEANQVKTIGAVRDDVSLGTSFESSGRQESYATVVPALRTAQRVRAENVRFPTGDGTARKTTTVRPRKVKTSRPPALHSSPSAATCWSTVDDELSEEHIRFIRRRGSRRDDNHKKMVINLGPDVIRGGVTASWIPPSGSPPDADSKPSASETKQALDWIVQGLSFLLVNHGLEAEVLRAVQSTLNLLEVWQDRILARKRSTRGSALCTTADTVAPSFFQKNSTLVVLFLSVVIPCAIFAACLYFLYQIRKDEMENL